MRRLLYLALRVFSAINYRLAERLTPAGWLVLAGAGAAGAAGIDTNQTLTYQGFTFLVALLLISLAASLRFRVELRLERALPRYLIAGETARYRLSLENRGARGLEGLTAVEAFADPRPSFREWRAAREPGEARRNWVDRKLGYFRWRWLIERRTPRWTEPAAVASIAAGSRASVTLEITPRRRGRLAIEGVLLGRSDPLGLLRGVARVKLPGHAIALPRRYRLPELAFAGKRRFQPGGVSFASSRGDSDEFLSLRDYRPGDPLHRMHWKSYARTGQPIVREYQDEFFERHALILDTGSAHGEDAAFEDAIAIAASFVQTVDTRECLLELLFVAEGNPHEPAVRSYTAGETQLLTEHMLEVLAGVSASAPAAFDALARAVLAQRAQLSSCILVSSYWDASRAALGEALRRSGIELRAVCVSVDGAAPPQAPAWLVVAQPGAIEAGLAKLR